MPVGRTSTTGPIRGDGSAPKGPRKKVVPAPHPGWKNSSRQSHVNDSAGDLPLMREPVVVQPVLCRGVGTDCNEMLSSNTAVSKSVLAPLSSLSPAAWCQAFFILASAGVLAVAATPATARRYLLDYGARNPGQQDSVDDRKGERSRGEEGPFVELISMLTSWGQVPHSWFSAFYTTSLACSMFWLVQYLTNSRALDLVCSTQTARQGPSMTIGQVFLSWTLMFLQASRRVYEHLVFSKPSNSKMWIVHWLLGIAFYLCMSISVWIEGSGKVETGFGWRTRIDRTFIDSIRNRPLDLSNTGLVSPQTAIALVAYMFAWTSQYWCHKYLAGLKKYSLPKSGMFRFLICPHYTCECFLYASLMVAAAPEGSLYNKTMLCALFFVSVNLGVTAEGTRQWYIRKFGSDSVAARWNMIPFVF